VLHQYVPDVPGKYNYHESVQSAEIKPKCRQKDDGRRQQELETVPRKQLPVSVDSKESGQVMAEGKEGQKKE